MKLGTFSRESEKLSEIEVKSETEGKCITASWRWMLLLPTSVIRKSLMAKIWYPTNFSELYVNGKYRPYYKLTGMAKIDPSLADGKIKKLTPLLFRLVSDEIVN